MNHASKSTAATARNLCVSLILLVLVLLPSAFAQSGLCTEQNPCQPFWTSRGDNVRDGANINEPYLTPSNVNENSFGRLFSVPVDYVVMAQPLYMPNVNIPGQGIHNVVYVATMADSVYAIDADNGVQLWQASMLNGGITASGTDLPCGLGPGFNQEGILGTPVIDTASNTMYLVAKTVFNGTVQHNLHALDITTGNDLPGSPTLIAATSTSNKGHKTTFNSLHQKNRPGLLLLNGVLYLGFGSNSCNDSNSGWVLSYDEASLSPVAVFNTSPDYGLTSIWQAGNGIAADEAGNIFVETAEAGANGFDVPSGGQTYCNSVVKLFPESLTVADYFTPYTVSFLNSWDLDLSSTGTLILPDQPGPYPHELIASGKQGFIYVLNRDDMGMQSVSDSQVVQKLSLIPGESSSANPDVDIESGGPALWNNTLYFGPDGYPLVAYPLSGGQLGTPVSTAAAYEGGHSPTISANGTTNGIVWAIEGSRLLSFDAVSLKMLYATTQAPNNRDILPPHGHFVTQTVADGKLYVGTNGSLEVYGLFHTLTVTGGAQSAMIATALPSPIQVEAANPYTGQPDVGATITFSDGGKGGSFNPVSAISDANGNVSTIYTVPAKTGTYTLTISGTISGATFGNATTIATATTSGPVKMIAYGGSNQTGAAGSTLPKALVAQVQDASKNGVPGVTVTFTANNGGIPNPSSAVTNASGKALATLQLPTSVAKITVTASSSGLANVTFVEHSVTGSAVNIAGEGGNGQFGAVGTQLPLALVVLVTDQYNNPIAGAGVTFSDGGAGGTFSNSNPVATGSNGTASQFYTLPGYPGSVTINATVPGAGSPAVFTETAQ